MLWSKDPATLLGARHDLRFICCSPSDSKPQFPTATTTALGTLDLQSRPCFIFLAHKFVASAQSPVFKAMFSPDACWIEARAGWATIDLRDEMLVTPDGLEAFLRYFYTCKIEINGSNLLPLFHLSNKYDVPFVFQSAKTFLIANLQPNQAVDLAGVATQCFGGGKSNFVGAGAGGGRADDGGDDDEEDAGICGNDDGETKNQSKQQLLQQEQDRRTTTAPNKRRKASFW